MQLGAFLKMLAHKIQIAARLLMEFYKPMNNNDGTEEAEQPPCKACPIKVTFKADR